MKLVSFKQCSTAIKKIISQMRTLGILREAKMNKIYEIWNCEKYGSGIITNIKNKTIGLQKEILFY